VKCRHCGADHMTEFCEKAGNSAARERLTPGTKALVRRDMRRPGGKASVGAAHEVTVAPDRATPPPPQAPAPPTAAHTGSSTTPDQQTVAQAHAAAAAATSSCTDATSAANAYAAALRALGLCARVSSHAARGRTETPEAILDHSVAPPTGTSVRKALTDSMATFWVVNSIDLLWRVDQPNPNLSIDTADGAAPVAAIGTSLVYLMCGSTWECYE
jgi:hypothetical protein